MAHCGPCVKDSHTACSCLCHSDNPYHLLHEAPSLFSELYRTNHKQKQRLQETKPLLCLCPPELPWLTWQKFLSAYDLSWRAWQDSRRLTAVCHSALQVRDLCSLPYRKPLAVIFQALVYRLSLRKIHILKLERVSCTAGTGQCPAASQ